MIKSIFNGAAVTFTLVSLFAIIGCSQRENQYFEITRKLVSFIEEEDTTKIQALIVARLEDVPSLKQSLKHNMKRFNRMISHFGPPEKYELKRYPEGDIKLCDVIVRVGNDFDYGILTTSFFRYIQPDSIFIFDFSFDTNAKGVINAPEEK